MDGNQDWRLTWAAASCRVGSQLPQGKAPYCGLGLHACAEICAFTFGLRLSSEPNFSPRLRRSPPWPRNQPFLARLQIFFSQREVIMILKKNMIQLKEHWTRRKSVYVPVYLTCVTAEELDGETLLTVV
ncbi:uncharacterized protein ACOB8E_009738 [Sarcophilus harrisii]